MKIIWNGVLIDTHSEKIKMGDLVYMTENEWSLVDFLLLSYVSSNDYCYIDTSNLDGEKTLKPKLSIL